MLNNKQDNDNQPLDLKFSLEPKIHSLASKFLEQKDKVFDLINAHGSPLNIIFPQLLKENIKSFEDVYVRNNLSGCIYFTTKPNKSLAVIKEAALCNVGADVSSLKALQRTLGAGFSADRIECTGPKNIDYLTLAIQQGVTINVDNFDEFNQVISIKKALSHTEKTKIFIRITGFHSDRIKFTSQDGTFGIHINHSNSIFEALEAHREILDFRGFAYHFVPMAQEQRIVALESTLKLTLEAIEKGFSPKGIDIGGGFEIQYAKSRKDWLNYLDQLKNSLRDYDQSLTWNNGGLGFRLEGEIIKGAPAFMDHAKALTGAEEFEDLISTPLPSYEDMSIADVLKDCMLELYIEPGRSLLDNVGMTIAQVNFKKHSTHGETLIGLSMNRSNTHSTHQKLLTDPVVLYKNDQREICKNGVYYIGNLCLSYDMITYNKTFPEKIPEQGDLVCFINTAAYIMDFVESETLHQNIADKLAIVQTKQGLKHYKDDQYNPIFNAMVEQ